MTTPTTTPLHPENILYTAPVDAAMEKKFSIGKRLFLLILIWTQPRFV